MGSTLEGSDCVLKQFWEFEATFVMGSLGVYSFSLSNFMGFKLWEIMVGSMFKSWGLDL